MRFSPPPYATPEGDPQRAADKLGCELAYWSRGSGPPVLFIQGTGLHGNGWLPQVHGLSGTHSCLWFDNRGMGLSTPIGSATLSVEQMAEDAAHVMDAAGWPSANVVGHSLGGCIALQLSLASPERVRSLALLCTSADGPGLVRLSPAMIWRGIRMNLGSKASRRNAFLEVVLTKTQHAEWDLAQVATELEPLFGHDLGVTPPVVMKQVRAMGAWSAQSRLADLKKLPTLVVGADEDLIARPPLVRKTADAIAGAELVELDNAAHGVVATEPGRVNELLLTHFKRAESRSLSVGTASS